MARNSRPLTHAQRRIRKQDTCGIIMILCVVLASAAFLIGAAARSDLVMAGCGLTFAIAFFGAIVALCEGQGA